MDPILIILLAIALIVVLTAVFAFFTYLFLSMFRRGSRREMVEALRGRDKKKGA